MTELSVQSRQGQIPAFQGLCSSLRLRECVQWPDACFPGGGQRCPPSAPALPPWGGSRQALLSPSPTGSCPPAPALGSLMSVCPFRPLGSVIMAATAQGTCGPFPTPGVGGSMREPAGGRSLGPFWNSAGPSVHVLPSSRCTSMSLSRTRTRAELTTEN